MNYKDRRYRGYLFADLTAALAILGLLLACFAVSLDGFRRYNHYQLVRQRCIAAAQAELDCIATTGKPISNEDFKRLWPRVELSITQSPGLGQWQGLKLVEVTAKGKSFNKQAQIKLCRYILEKQTLAKGE